jgi:hypothetical protein
MAEPQRTSPGLGFWLAITASALAGLFTMTRRPGFQPADVLVPVAFGVAAVGVLIAIQQFGPPPIRDLARSQRFLVAFTLCLAGLLVIWALVALG